VPTMLEGQERVYFPPVPAGVAALNRAVPRFGSSGGFTVPGMATGDRVPMWVPSGSFILNRKAAGAGGYQDGGQVQGGNGGGNTEVHYHFPNITFREGVTPQQFKSLMREWESMIRRQRGDTRL
jgi:hypothetical protein